jgi:hypothetical protein
MGAGGTGAAGAIAPVAQTVRGQYGGNRLPFLPELRFEIRRYSQKLEFITILSNV